MAETIIVVPCFNEARRLPVQRFERFAETQPSIQFLMVNDGSTDETLETLEGMADRHDNRFSVIDVQPNQGKAEAVRQGMLTAFKREPRYMGFWDADLATPLDAITDFVALLDQRPELEMIFGSRVNLLGRSIQRSPVRHYLGRVFATSASVALGLAVYDTQCGAKLFRSSKGIQGLLAEPFITRWIFDVEIIARLVQARRGTELPQPEDVIYEFPLHNWQDVAGSKVKPSDFPKALFEIMRIYCRYLRD